MLIAGTQEFMLFCLILMRMTGFIFMNPITGRRDLPTIAKTGMALVFALLIASTETANVPQIETSIEFGILLLKEFAIGYLLGTVMQLFVFVCTYAGSIIDYQMALGMASIYDAQSGIQVALTGNILNVYLMLLFFAVDGHLALFDILITSSEIVPYAQVALGPEAAQAVITIFIDCVILAVKIALPIIGTVLLLDIGVGVLMKIIPQITLFILDIPIKILMGFGMLMFLTSPIGDYLGNLITDMLKALQHVLTTI